MGWFPGNSTSWKKKWSSALLTPPVWFVADRLPASISLLYIIGGILGRWFVERQIPGNGFPKVPGEAQEIVNSYSYSQAVQGTGEPGSLKIKIIGWARSPLLGSGAGPYGQREKLGDLVRLLTHLGVASTTHKIQRPPDPWHLLGEPEQKERWRPQTHHLPGHVQGNQEPKV